MAIEAETSWASSPGRRRNMQANRARDTKPELAVRRLLHRRGLRYRTAMAPEPGLRRRADIVFTRMRIAIFIDGCFWHGCPEHGRREFRYNVDYWPGKIAANVARDQDTNDKLRSAGWLVLRFWEHENPGSVADAIEKALRCSYSGLPDARLRKVAKVRVGKGTDHESPVEEAVELLAAGLRK
jgi:DNA mismatch endonuclease (patch repair protein)